MEVKGHRSSHLITADRLIFTLMDVDLTSFCKDGCEAGFISLAVKANCDSLEDNVSDSTKVRYLWLHVCQQVRENSRLWERLLTVLSKHGVPIDVLEELRLSRDSYCPVESCSHVSSETEGLAEGISEVLCDYGGGDVVVGKKRPHGGHKYFTERHISILTEILAKYSHKWQEIGLCLNIPHINVMEIISTVHINSIEMCFSKVLREWIVGNHEFANPPTIENLQETLCSNIVGLGDVANDLQQNLLKHGVCLENDEPSTAYKRPRLDTASLEVVSQTRDCVVREEKSTLLEVQVDSTNSLSYQWMKDGSPLTDSTSDGYSGTETEILCIENASLSSEGTYSCEIKCNEDQAVVIHSEPLVVTVEMSPLKKVLVDIYNAQPEVPEDSWPPVSNNTYINLALIKSGNIDNANEYTRYTIQNDMDDIYNNKDHTEYEEVFSDLPSGSRLLIEGRPGSGKTTLVHKFSQDWANNKLKLKGVKFLFLVHLRGFFSSADIQLRDIIKQFYNDQCDVEGILSFAKQSNGEGLCFVLDGLDEYSPKNKRNTQIFKLINKQIYPKAIVVVASRPAATHLIRQVASKRVEVLGFLREQISEYIYSYKFKGPGTNITLRACLEQRQNVKRMCYLPRHAVVVCYLFDMDGFLPPTETQMYTQFTVNTLLCTLHRHEDNDIKYLNSIDDLPEEERKIYSEICKLSFEKTILSKQVMKHKEVEHFFSKVNCGKDSLGLITVDRIAEKYLFQDLYTFLHLTHQEYLAAYHISKLEEKEQAKVVEKYVGKKHMLVVWKFYCGLVDFTDQVSKFEKMMTKSKDDLFPVQCAFESQQSITCDYLAKSREESSLTFRSQFLTPSDFVAIGYIVNKATYPVKKLVLDRCHFREVVSGFLEEVGDKISLIKTLCFHGGNCVREQFMSLNSLLKNLKSLEELDITGTKIGSKKAEDLCKDLSLPCLQTIRFPENFERSMLDHFIISPVLKRIALLDYENYFDRTKVFGVSAVLFSLTAANEVNIAELKVSLSHDDIQLLSACLRENSCCTSLILTHCSIDDRGVKTLADSFSHITSLRELKLNLNMIGDEGAKTLSDSLRSCTQICHLDLSFNYIGSDGAKALADCLKLCNNLQKLDLEHNSIGSDGAKALADCLEHCNNLQTLDLGCNSIGSDGAVVLANGLKHCSNLQTLNLEKNSIGSDGAKAIADGLMHCGSLQTLNLCYSSIGSDGAKALADNLKHCNNLQTLHLEGSNISSDGAKALRDALKHCNILYMSDLEKDSLTDDNVEVEEENFLQGLEEAYKNKGKINRKLAHIMFVGPPGSGKSSLMDRLLGRLRKKFSSSTGVCDSIVIVDIDISNPTTFTSATLQDNTWKETECDASFVKQMIEDNTHTQGLEDTPASPTNNETVSQQLHDVEVDDNHASISLTQEPSSSDEPTKMIQRPVEPNNTVMSPTSPKSVKLSSRPFRESVLSVIKKYGLNVFKESLEKTSSLYLRDTGGQVEFQEMLALLISAGLSIVIFVFRTDQDFKSKFKVRYRKSASESLNCYTSSITIEEALLQSLASVYAMDTSSNDIVKMHKPLVFIVGTHIDKLDSAERVAKIIDLNKYLCSIVEQNGFSDLVQYADNDKHKVMFAVDNTSESEDNFQLIRSRVSSLISDRSEFNIEYPMSYLLFCLDLQKIKKSVISLKDCRKLADMHDIRGDQVLHLLRFLHLRIGLIRYYDVDGLRDLVIIEPQVLFNRATDLIAITFSTGSLLSREVNDLEKKGILSAKAFESLKCFNEICRRKFLQLLVHLRITAPVHIAGDEEERYFIPCILNHVSESTEENQKSDILPLCVKFKCNHCPKGIFGVLITYLMRPERVDHNTTFELIDNKIFKDQVSFQVSSLGVVDEITLKLFISHLEISFFPDLCDKRDTTIKEVCNNIRLIIEKSILSSLKDLHYKKEKVEPMMCFKCEHCSELHKVTKGKYCRQIYCTKTSRIPLHGRCWFNESDDDNGAESSVNAGNSQSCSTDALPQSSQHGQSVANEPRTLDIDDHLQEVLDTVKPVAAKWNLVSIKLGISAATREIIKKNHPDDVVSCLCNALEEWLKLNYKYQKHGKPSWKKLAEAMKDIDGALHEKILRSKVVDHQAQTRRLLKKGSPVPDPHHSKEDNPIPDLKEGGPISDSHQDLLTPRSSPSQRRQGHRDSRDRNTRSEQSRSHEVEKNSASDEEKISGHQITGKTSSKRRKREHYKSQDCEDETSSTEQDKLKKHKKKQAHFSETEVGSGVTGDSVERNNARSKRDSPSPVRNRRRSKERRESPGPLRSKRRLSSSPVRVRKRSRSKSISKEHEQRMRRGSPQPKGPQRNRSPEQHRSISSPPPKKQRPAYSNLPQSRRRSHSSSPPRSRSPLSQRRRSRYRSPPPHRRRSCYRSPSPQRRCSHSRSPSPQRRRSHYRSPPQRRCSRSRSPSPQRRRSRYRSPSPQRRRSRYRSPSPQRRRSRYRSPSPQRRHFHYRSPSPQRRRSRSRS